MTQWLANTVEYVLDFSNILNTSIAASWMVLAVIFLRLILKKVPRWTHVALWGLVAVRLLLPFSIESSLSLIPSAETIPREILVYEGEALQNSASLDVVTNPVFPESVTVDTGETVDRVQIGMVKMTLIWVAGMATLLVYTIASYWRLQRKVSEAVIFRDNIYQSENVTSPFVLGIFQPKIYLHYNIDGQELSHVIAHEQAHIRRRDHWWKPLGFLLLTVHWFNPMMWIAYILLCRDIELACDEKVIKEMGNEQRADYTQALVSCSINRRLIAACPLAFGEVGIKERVKSVMNYKKPAFWVIVVSLITCAVVEVCFLTNPAAEREFPINGRNVSDLDTAYVLEKIARAEKLEDGSKLCINEDGFDLMFTADFDWANDGAIRFFYYGKNQKIYNAQLRMFHDDNKYFITDSSEWIEQEQIFKLFHYLDALKYMPQEEIRQLSPDADSYSVMMRHEGAPIDYERVLKYSQNGVNANDGWYIHLEVLPLHEVEGGGYNGTGDEVIHLFYNSGDERDDLAGKTYLYEKEGIMGSFTITLYEDGTFTYYEGMASSYIGTGTFMLDGDTVIMTDDRHGGYGLVNHFRRDGDDLVFVEQDSDNFVYVKVKDGEKFSCTGEAFKPGSSVDEPKLKLQENTVVEIGRGTLKSAVELNDEDVTSLLGLIESGGWVESADMPDCDNDCAINLGGRLVYYSSKSGTFTEYDLSEMTTTSHQTPSGGRYWAMPIANQLFINNILCRYIDLVYGITDVPAPEDSPDESGYNDTLHHNSAVSD